MECERLMNLVDNIPNQPNKLRRKNWVEINGDSRGPNRIGSQVRFKTSVLKSRSCDYRDAYILVSGTISVANTAAQAAEAN